MASDKLKAILYAADTTLVCTVSAIEQNAGAPDCKLHELTRIYEWLALNKLNLNINKTKYIIFHFPTFFLFWKCLDYMSYWTNLYRTVADNELHFFTISNLNYTVFVSLAHIIIVWLV